MHNAMLTIRDVCDRLALSKPDSVLKAINAGELLASNISMGKRPTWRIDPADLETFLQRRRAVVVPKSERAKPRRKMENVIQFF